MRSQEPLGFIRVFSWQRHQHHHLFCSQPQEVLNIVQQPRHNTHCTRARARILLQCIFSQANLEREKENTPLKQGTVATIKKLNEIADS
jgi:hypothetical protein